MTMINLEKVKEDVFSHLMGCEICSYMTMYAPDKTVITTNNLVKLTGYTRYAVKKALKALIEDGIVEYTSQGCPAIVSYGEVAELVCEARPPINGYTMTKKGFETQEWKKAYAEWNKSMEEWANRGWEDV